MSREAILKELLESKDESELAERIDRIEKKVDLLLSCIVVQQKDVSGFTDITPQTIRNKAIRGEIDVLQRDGSRHNYLTLTEVAGLKIRRRGGKRK